MEVVKITRTKMLFIAPAIYGRKVKHHLSTRTKDIPARKTLYEKACQPLTTQRQMCISWVVYGPLPSWVQEQTGHSDDSHYLRVGWAIWQFPASSLVGDTQWQIFRTALQCP
jgi:hypothetical protein